MTVHLNNNSISHPSRVSSPFFIFLPLSVPRLTRVACLKDQIQDRFFILLESRISLLYHSTLTRAFQVKLVTSARLGQVFPDLLFAHLDASSRVCVSTTIRYISPS